MRYPKHSHFLIALMALTLAACGGSTSQPPGGSGSNDGNGNQGNPNGNDNSTTSIISSSPQLQSDADTAAEGVTLTVLVRDQNNNAVANADVAFAADSGALVNTQNTTDTNGTATAALHTGSDPRNRNITVTATSGGSQDSVQIAVVGTQLGISGPDSIVFGDNADYTITLADAAGDGIANETVNVSSANSNGLSMTSSSTDASGQTTIRVFGDTDGQDTLTAQALGLTATKTITVSADEFQITTPANNTEVNLGSNQVIQVNWQRNGNPIADNTPVDFSTTRGTFMSTGTGTATVDTSGGNASVTIQSNDAGPATITATGRAATGDQPTTQIMLEFIATNPDSVVAQADPTTVAINAQSQIRAVVRDPNNNPVKNQIVDFNLVDPTAGGLSTPNGTTDSQGIARTTYTAGGSQSGQDAVNITATVRGTSVQDSVELTVSRQALDIALGTGNEIMEPDNTRFQLPFTVVVTDSAGNPASGASVQLNLISVVYLKGQYQLRDTDDPPDGTADQWVAIIDGVCDSEDADGDGTLDDGEDLNNDEQLTPGNVATVPSAVTLNDDGFGFFSTTYPQDRNAWVGVRLRASASVSGSEGMASREFILPALQADLLDTNNPPPGQVSPYGTGPCP